LEKIEALAVSGNGSEVYAFGSDSLVIFAREPSTGNLTEASCASKEDSRCASAASLDGVNDAAVSSDGREVYVTTNYGDVMVLALGAATTTAQASASRAGVARIAVACPRALRRSCVGRVMLLRSVMENPTRIGSRKRAHRRQRSLVRRISAGYSAPFAIRPGTHATISVRLSSSSLRLLDARRRLRLMAVVRANPLDGGSGYGRALTVKLNPSPR